MISFRRGKTKVRIITEERVTTPHNTSPLYAEGVHMLDGLADEEVDDFLEDHPTIIPLFEIDVIPAIDTPRDEEVTEAPPHPNALEMATKINVDTITSATIRKKLGLSNMGERYFNIFPNEVLERYFGEHSLSAKAYRTWDTPDPFF